MDVDAWDNVTGGRFVVEGGAERLDRYLAEVCGGASRTRCQAWIAAGAVRVDGAVARKATQRVPPGAAVEVSPPPVREVPGLVAVAGELRVLFEDADMLAVDKPAGLVVHPAAGHESDTLVNYVLHACGDLGGVGDERRPGIVHRLDRDTSGVMVVAKSDAGYRGLARQFAEHAAEKEYAALCWGRFRAARGTVEGAIGRDPRNRKKMALVERGGRDATTHWEVARQGQWGARLRVRIETGRTHQIRVHMASLGHPVWGDAVYGRRHVTSDGWCPARQMLHAARLRLRHPVSGVEMVLEAPVPADFVEAEARMMGGEG